MQQTTPGARVAMLSQLVARFRQLQDSTSRPMDHGWEVPLCCTHCGAESLPDYRGWTPRAAIRLGDRGTIYAQLFCARCGHELRQEAERKLAELFRDVATPPANRRALWLFVGYYGVVLVVAVAAELIWPLERRQTSVVMAVLFAAAGPVAVWFRWRMRRLQTACPCGTPRNRFMGMLGRSYCLRCSNCGRLLRLRD